MKRRRKRFPCQRAGGALNLVSCLVAIFVIALGFLTVWDLIAQQIGTSSETSPVETVSINVQPTGKRSRKVAKIHTICAPGFITKREKAAGKQKATADAGAAALVLSERRRTKSEHDCSVTGGSNRSRLSSSYKEG